MTKNERLKAFLSEYLPYVDSRVPTEIDMGGCAVFALHLSDQLDKMHIPHTIEALIFKGDEWSNQEVANLMKLVNTGKGRYDIAEDHVAIRVDGMLFDSLGSLCDGDGSFRSDMPPIKKVIIIPKPILMQQIAQGHWMPVFDKEQEPLIKHLLLKMPKALYTWEPGMYFGQLGPKKLNKYTKEAKQGVLHKMEMSDAIAGEMGVIFGDYENDQNVEGRV